MARTQKEEIVYLDLLRILACFLVIINHTNEYILNYPSIINTTFYSMAFSLCKVAVGLFLMITGTLVLDKNYDYKKIIKCILRVLIPVFCISFLLYVKETGINSTDIFQFLKSFTGFPYIFPYWYVYALIGLYLTLPYLQKMVKNFTNKDYVRFTILFLIVPSFIALLNTYFNIEIHESWNYAFFTVIVAFIVCGNYISKIKKTKRILICSTILFMVSYIGMFFSVYIPYLKNGKISYALDSWYSFPVVIMATSLFYIVRYIFENKNYSKRLLDIISLTASATFGIYIIHPFLNHRLYDLELVQRIFQLSGIMGIIILDLAVFIISLIIIYILKKIHHIISKHLYIKKKGSKK